MATRLKVLMSAYACEPSKGSEPEVGWQWALQMARFHDVTVLTRSNNRPAIEPVLNLLQSRQPLPQFVYHDCRPLLVKFKRRFKATKSYYVLWQRSAQQVVRQLQQAHHFDLLHHVTFAAFRYPTAIWEQGAPSIWGPVGGIESIPTPLLPWRHPVSLIHEIPRNAHNFLHTSLFPALRRRARASTLLLATTREMQVAFAKLDDLMDLGEGLVSFVVARCLEKRRTDLETIGRKLEPLEKITPPFPRISYDEAIQMLQEGHARGALEHRFEWGGDLGSPDETYLSGLFDKPVMVHRYPAQVKAFYMEPDPQRPELALCVDVLAPEGYGEIIGGSQRMASYELLRERIRAHGLPEEAFGWYLDLRKYGSVPHGGFGMGIERVVAWICGLEHVRETIPFARTLHRLYP